MGIKIIPASTPITVSTICVVIYAVPGSGKTSLAQTASRPLLLDFDRGAHRSANRKDTVQVSAWSDVTAIGADDLNDYDTVIVDTAGRALDTLP